MIIIVLFVLMVAMATGVVAIMEWVHRRFDSAGLDYVVFMILLFVVAAIGSNARIFIDRVMS